jgi:hypothetical protein
MPKLTVEDLLNFQLRETGFSLILNNGRIGIGNNRHKRTKEKAIAPLYEVINTESPYYGRLIHPKTKTWLSQTKRAVEDRRILGELWNINGDLVGQTLFRYAMEDNADFSRRIEALYNPENGFPRKEVNMLHRIGSLIGHQKHRTGRISYNSNGYDVPLARVISNLGQMLKYGDQEIIKGYQESIGVDDKEFQRLITLSRRKTEIQTQDYQGWKTIYSMIWERILPVALETYFSNVNTRVPASVGYSQYAYIPTEVSLIQTGTIDTRIAVN